MEDEDKAEQIIQRNTQMQSAVQQGQMDLVTAQVKEVLTRALEHEAKAQSEGAQVGITVFQTIIDAITKGNKHSVDQAKTMIAAQSADNQHTTNQAQALIAAHGADTARMAAEKPVAATGGAV